MGCAYGCAWPETIRIEVVDDLCDVVQLGASFHVLGHIYHALPCSRPQRALAELFVGFPVLRVPCLLTLLPGVYLQSLLLITSVHLCMRLSYEIEPPRNMTCKRNVGLSILVHTCAGPLQELIFTCFGHLRTGAVGP